MSSDRALDQTPHLSNPGEILEYYRCLWPNERPIFKLFRTERTGYIYDTGTNKVFGCGNIEFEFFRNVQDLDIGEALERTALSSQPDEFVQAMEGIRKIINQSNVLKGMRPIRFSGDHFSNIKEQLQTRLGLIQLEITERCNLRCGYCVYSSHFKEKRNHSMKDMRQSTAFMAIDHLRKYSQAKESVSVGFYGGEPLLCFPLIQSCVRYARAIMKAPIPTFTITTNATLVTPSIAKYLRDEEFGVLVSIDGPQDVHDDYRKDLYGVGSFERTLTGLRTLYDVFGQDKSRLSISMVYGPPYSRERIDRIASLWDMYPWISRDMVPTISYPLGYQKPLKNNEQSGDTDFSLFDWASENYLQAYKRGNRPHPIAVSIIEKELARFIKRNTHAAPRSIFALNGCCVPGVRKQFVCADESIMICERIGKAPAIGSVESGVDIELVEREYVTNYAEMSLPLCSDCWAVHLCKLCYMHAFIDGRIDLFNKGISCSVSRLGLEKMLTLFCQLLEIRASGLDHLKDYQFM